MKKKPAKLDLDYVEKYCQKNGLNPLEFIKEIKSISDEVDAYIAKISMEELCERLANTVESVKILTGEKNNDAAGIALEGMEILITEIKKRL